MPRRIKILYVETYTHVAGGQRGLLDLVQRLDSREFEPVALIQGPGRLQRELEGLGIRFLRRRLEPFKNRWLPFSWLLGVKPVAEVLRAEKPDLLHSNHLYAGRYGGRAAKALGVPSLVTLRLVPEPEIFDRYNRRNTLRCHDRVVSNSEAGRIAAAMDPALHGKLSTIKNGIGLERFRPFPDRAEARCRAAARYGLEENSLIIAQVASMVPQKGNEDLTRVFLDLCRRHPRLHLFLVGGPFAGTDNSDALRRLARDAGCENRLHLTEYVSDVPEFLNLADISVLCSREREGLPRCLIEAMACGNPLVGTDVGGTRELIDDGRNGFLIPPRNAGILREKLELLIEKPALRAAMGAAGLAKAREHHDIRAMMDKYRSLYRELAEKNVR